MSEAGISSMHARECLGRGKGLVDLDVLKGRNRDTRRRYRQLGNTQRLIPKRMISVVVPDKLVAKTVARHHRSQPDRQTGGRQDICPARLRRHPHQDRGDGRRDARRSVACERRKTHDHKNRSRTRPERGPGSRPRGGEKGDTREVPGESRAQTGKTDRREQGRRPTGRCPRSSPIRGPFRASSP